jgi:hypothetical protein
LRQAVVDTYVPEGNGDRLGQYGQWQEDRVQQEQSEYHYIGYASRR